MCFCRARMYPSSSNKHSDIFYSSTASKTDSDASQFSSIETSLVIMNDKHVSTCLRHRYSGDISTYGIHKYYQQRVICRLIQPVSCDLFATEPSAFDQQRHRTDHYHFSTSRSDHPTRACIYNTSRRGAVILHRVKLYYVTGLMSITVIIKLK